MGRQAYFITEIRPNKNIEFFTFSGYIPPQINRFDEEENYNRVELINSILNFKGKDLCPLELINEGDHHHSEEGEECEDSCICGWTNANESKDHLSLITILRNHSNHEFKFQNPPLKEHLDRIAYNEKHGITTNVEFWETDHKFNPITLIKSLGPHGLDE